MKIEQNKFKIFMLFVIVSIIVSNLFSCNKNNTKELSNSENNVPIVTDNQKQISKDSLLYIPMPSSIDVKIHDEEYHFSLKNEKSLTEEIIEKINTSLLSGKIGKIESQIRKEDLDEVMSSDYLSLVYFEQKKIKTTDYDNIEFDKMIIPLEKKYGSIILLYKGNELITPDYGIIQSPEKLKSFVDKLIKK